NDGLIGHNSSVGDGGLERIFPNRLDQSIRSKVGHSVLFKANDFEARHSFEEVLHELRIGLSLKGINDLPGIARLPLDREWFRSVSFNSVDRGRSKRKELVVAKGGVLLLDQAGEAGRDKHDIGVAQTSGVDQLRIIGGTLADLKLKDSVAAKGQDQVCFRR